MRRRRDALGFSCTCRWKQSPQAPVATEEAEAEAVDVEELLAAVHEQVPEGAQLQIESRDRHDDEWRDAWKKYFATRRIGRIAIVPSWERQNHKAEPDEITLWLDPGRAFGTGGHATTRLCLSLD
jgi:ribosomal protein L11 methyltransferase